MTMEGVMYYAASLLIIGYAIFSVIFICTRHSLRATAASAAGLLCGGVLLTFIAETLATVLCWGIAAFIVLLIIGLIFS